MNLGPAPLPSDDQLLDQALRCIEGLWLAIEQAKDATRETGTVYYPVPSEITETIIDNLRRRTNGYV